MTRAAGSDEDFDAVFAALRLSADLHELHPPASERSLREVEASLGRELPSSLKRLYEITDGAALFKGNLNIVPAAGPGDARLMDFSQFLRDAEWPIPAEVIMFGDTGGDELLGFWLPADASPAEPVPVVEVGEIFERDCMSLVGTDVALFLKGWCGYFLALYEAPDAAKTAIGLPRDLWPKSSAGSLARYLAWADPALPISEPDPYKDRLDAEKVRKLVASPHSAHLT